MSELPPLPPARTPSFWRDVWNVFKTTTGLTIFGIGFAAGVLPSVLSALKIPQPQQDIGTSMAQAMEAMIPMMMFAMMMQMFMGMFRAPVAMMRGVY